MLERTRRVLLDADRVPSPCFVVDASLLARNAAILDSVQERTGAKILLALKGFAMWGLFDVLSRAKHGPLYGVCASSPHEARLGREEFGGEVHAFAAAWSEADMAETLPYVDHIVFNSFTQWQRFAPRLAAFARERGRAIDVGLRLNPEHSEGTTPLYDPCAPGSRLGIRPHAFARAVREYGLDGIDGLHFHTLCEQGADALERTLAAVEGHFGRYFHGLRWLNFGGGHHITREGYDLDLLCRTITRTRERYNLAVYLEPGEAVALNAGWLVATVLDIVDADMPIAVLDTSAAAHMPDVLEMPYRPQVVDAGEPGQKPCTFRLAGKSCLAGDVIGEYSFARPLEVGQRLIFTDMAIYSMVKTTTFNGLQLPAIAAWYPERDALHILRRFGYADFKQRLS